MSNDLRKQIYSRMNSKETDELLEIWQSNHLYEWSDEAFEVINPSCDLPKEVDGTSDDKESNFEFKTSGSDRMNGFW
jgi:hypothetical protein